MGAHRHTDAVDSLRPEDRETVRRFGAWKHRPKVPVVRDSESPSPQQVYADLMKTTFAPALREAELRGSGGRFELPSETCWAQLGFQKSAYSDGQEVRFTVNVSVIRRDDWSAQVKSKPYLGRRPTPTARYGPWADQARIGQLTPDGEDKWWRLVRGDVDKDGAPVQITREMWLKLAGMLVVFATGGVVAIVVGVLGRPVDAFDIACGIGILLCFLGLLSGATITLWRRHHEDGN